jgi:hypothetical protein
LVTPGRSGVWPWRSTMYPPYYSVISIDIYLSICIIGTVCKKHRGPQQRNMH